MRSECTAAYEISFDNAILRRKVSLLPNTAGDGSHGKVGGRCWRRLLGVELGRGRSWACVEKALNSTSKCSLQMSQCQENLVQGYRLYDDPNNKSIAINSELDPPQTTSSIWRRGRLRHSHRQKSSPLGNDILQDFVS